MKEDVTWGDIYEAIGLGSHEQINISLEVLKQNIGKRCRITACTFKDAVGAKGVIEEVYGTKNYFRYKILLDKPVKIPANTFTPDLRRVKKVKQKLYYLYIERNQVEII